MRFALVGPTGCGKTTLINLLLRFYDIDAGHITVMAGLRVTTRAQACAMPLAWCCRIRGCSRARWRKTSPTAVPTPRASRLSKLPSARMRTSLSCSCQAATIPVIGEDGGTFSQGQKQLLCIARVMLTDPAILLLDEATSSIDTRTELQVQAAFDELMAGRTSFVVAHRLSTIRNADCILVMRDGQIIERGTHDELLAAGGFYAELYRSQFAQ